MTQSVLLYSKKRHYDGEILLSGMSYNMHVVMLSLEIIFQGFIMYVELFIIIYIVINIIYIY